MAGDDDVGAIPWSHPVEQGCELALAARALRVGSAASSRSCGSSPSRLACARSTIGDAPLSRSFRTSAATDAEALSAKLSPMTFGFSVVVVVSPVV